MSTDDTAFPTDGRSEVEFDPQRSSRGRGPGRTRPAGPGEFDPPDERRPEVKPDDLTVPGPGEFDSPDDDVWSPNPLTIDRPTVLVRKPAPTNEAARQELLKQQMQSQIERLERRLAEMKKELERLEEER